MQSSSRGVTHHIQARLLYVDEEEGDRADRQNASRAVVSRVMSRGDEQNTD